MIWRGTVWWEVVSFYFLRRQKKKSRTRNYTTDAVTLNRALRHLRVVVKGSVASVCTRLKNPYAKKGKNTEGKKKKTKKSNRQNGKPEKRGINILSAHTYTKEKEKKGKKIVKMKPCTSEKNHERKKRRDAASADEIAGAD